MKNHMKKNWLPWAVAIIALLLFAGSVQAATVLFPSGGGTGTSTAPTYGQVLVGNAGGTYGPQATSTLKISTTDIVEGTKLFFTNARAIASTLTGYSAGAGTITSSDTVLTAIQKLAGNAASYLTNITGYISAGTNITITGSGTSGSPYVINSSGGGGGGSGNVATSTTETAGQLAYWTSTGATPATLGKAATTTLAGSGVITISNSPVLIGASPAVATITGGTNGQILGWSGGVPTWLATTTAGTGLTYSGGAFNVNTSQNISTLSNLTANGLVKTSGGTGALSIATAGTDYQAPITLTTTGSSGAATFIANTLNIPQYAGATYTATYPITLTGSAFGIAFGTTTSNTWAGTQTFTNAPVFTSLTSGGLAVDASGNVYKAATTTAGTGLTYSGNAFNVNTSQNISTLSNLTGNGLVKTSGGTGALSIAAAGTDYAPATSGSSILKGNGSGGFSNAAAGTDYAPATSGSSLLYGNGSGGFSNATISTGIQFSGGAISNTGLLSLQQLGGGTAQTGAITLATTSNTTNGITSTLSITNTAGAFTFSTNQSGTLTVGGGGTGVATLTGLAKGNGTSAFTAAVNGTDFTLITAKTCTAGDFVSSLTAAGVFTCTTPAGYSPVGTTGQLPYFSGTNTLTATSNLFLTAGGSFGIGSTSPSALATVGYGYQPSAFTVASTSVWTGAGSYTYTAPTGTAFITLTEWGGGGGGGANGGGGSGGGGGGAGSFVASSTVFVNPGQTGTIYVAGGGSLATGGVGYKVGGAGGSQGGGGGGSSAFTASTTGQVIVACGGGGGGQDSAGTAGSITGGTGGSSASNSGGGGACATVGTAASGATGGPGGTGGNAVRFASGSGFAGVAGTSNGGGGSAAGMTGAGKTATTTDGAPGSNNAIHAAAGAGYDSGGGGSAGETGGNPGAGGGGKAGSGSPSAGAGSSGKVIITAYGVPAGTSGAQLIAGLLTVNPSSITIGTTTAMATLTIQGTEGGAVEAIYGVINAVVYAFQTLDAYGHLITQGPAPTISTCGTTPTVVGNDRNGTVSNASSVIACTLTFAKPWDNVPQCTVVPHSSSIVWLTSRTVSGFTMNFGTTSANGFDYVCQGYK